MRITALIVALLLAAGCSTSNGNDNGDEPEEAVAENPQQVEDNDDSAPAAGPGELEHDPREKLSMWSREGLTAQDRMEDLKEQRDDFEPGTTLWAETDHEIPARLTEEGDERTSTPGALLSELTEALRLTDALGQDVWEQTTRVFYEDDDHVTGMIMQWGIKDDSMAGTDFRVRMGRDDDGWFVAEVEQRFHCARGVTEDQLCL